MYKSVTKLRIAQILNRAFSIGKSGGQTDQMPISLFGAKDSDQHNHIHFTLDPKPSHIKSICPKTRKHTILSVRYCVSYTKGPSLEAQEKGPIHQSLLCCKRRNAKQYVLRHSSLQRDQMTSLVVRHMSILP
jgi:hypothetical protein